MTRLTGCGLESGPKVATGLVERYNKENMTLKKNNASCRCRNVADGGHIIKFILCNVVEIEERRMNSPCT